MRASSTSPLPILLETSTHEGEWGKTQGLSRLLMNRIPIRPHEPESPPEIPCANDGDAGVTCLMGTSAWPPCNRRAGALRFMPPGEEDSGTAATFGQSIPRAIPW